MDELNLHIHATWKKYTWKQRSEREHQIIPLAFIVECNGVVSYDKEAFYDHAWELGATTRHELEFVGDPVFVAGVEFSKPWQKSLDRMRFLYSLELRDIEDSGCFYYPIEQIVWTSHKNLSRRKTVPNLTTYGMKHWKGGQITRVTAWGESKSGNAWANDPRGVVSDKIIKRRINAGWSPEAAISTPAGMKP